MRSWRVTKIHSSTPPPPPLPPPFLSLSKDEGIKNIGHSMSITNLILGVNSVTVSYLIRYDSLLQNATAILLQSATGVYYKMRRVFYYKIRPFCYKIQQLLQNATMLLQNATLITKYDVCYKLRQYRALRIPHRS